MTNRPTEVYAKEKAAKENALALLEMLERLEWQDSDSHCLLCFRYSHEGHESDCPYDALLTAANPNRKGGGV